MADVASRKVDIEDVVLDIAPQFNVTFTSLLKVMEIREEKEQQKREKLAKLASRTGQASSSIPISSALITTLKRPASSSIAATPLLMKRQKSQPHDPGSPFPQQRPSTPDQPTVQADPTLTGDTAYSGDSTASKPEDSTSRLLHNFVDNIQSILYKDFKTLTWPKSQYPIHLTKTYSLDFGIHSLMNSESDTAYFALGKERIKVINDGGLGINYYTGRNFVRSVAAQTLAQCKETGRQAGEGETSWCESSTII